MLHKLILTHQKEKWFEEYNDTVMLNILILSLN